MAIVIAAIFQLWVAVVIRRHARKLQARDASKLIERIYQDEDTSEDVEFEFPYSDEGVVSGGRVQVNEDLDLGSGPWTRFGEFAGGITRWIRYKL